MAVSVTHTFVSPVADGGDPNEVGPDEWNAAHTISGLGSAAEADATDFATAAQGAKADTALQAADIANMLETSDIGVSVQAYDADLTAWAGVNPSSYSTTAEIAAAYQPLDSDLTTLAGLTATTDNFIVSVSSAWASRTPAQVRTTLGLVIGTNVQAYDADLTTWAGLTPSANAQSLVTAADYAAMRTLLGLVIGTNVQAYDADLAALAANSTDGLWAHTGAGTGAARTLTAPAAGLTISNPAGIAGNPTFALANDLSAVEGLASNGMAARTATDTWAVRTITGTSAQITVTNGDGVSGNPTLSLPSDVLIPTVLTVPNTGLHILDSNASHDLIVKPGSNITADRTLTVTTGDTDITIDLTDAGSDKLMFWDDSAGAWTALTLGTNLTITGTTLDASGGSGGVEVYSTAQPTSDTNAVSFTGLSGCRVVEFAFAWGMIASNGSTSLTLQGRVSGGTWRSFATLLSPTDTVKSRHYVRGTITGFNANQDMKNVFVTEVRQTNSTHDASDATNILTVDTNAANGRLNGSAPSWNEVWDELQLITGSGNRISGSTTDERGWFTVWGFA